MPAKTMEQRWDDENSNNVASTSSPPASVAAEAAQAQPWPAADTERSKAHSHSKKSSKAANAGVEGSSTQQGTGQPQEDLPAVMGSSDAHAEGQSASSSYGSKWWGQAHDAALVEPISTVQVDPNELLRDQQNASDGEGAQQVAGKEDASAAVQHQQQPGEGSQGQNGNGSKDSEQHQQQAHPPKRPKAPRAWGPVASVRGEGI